MNNLELISVSENHFSEIVQMMEDFYAIDGYPFDIDAKKVVIQTLIQNEDLGKLWLIKIDEKTAGYVCLTYGFSLEYGGKTALLDELFLKSDFRKQGLGQKIITYIENYLKKTEVKSLQLEVESHNENAKKLYFNNGFYTASRTLLTKKI